MALQGQYLIETPEQIEVAFDLAGPGSRFCAFLIDTTMVWVAIFVTAVVLVLAGTPLIRSLERESGSEGDAWFVAFFIVGAAVGYWGYYTFFELIMRGQTPGKRSMRIRVIHDDGTPATAMDIVVRNLVRLVDALPGIYLIGGLTAMLSAQHKRLGDMAAGTVVVKEGDLDYHAKADPKRKLPLPEMVVANAALSVEEQRLVRGFLQRRLELLPDARTKLAVGLAARLHAKHGGDLSDPEAYLERLAEGRQFDPG